ncbi:MAG TPA: hypothetical protein VFV58_10575 [Blastocatellia bacterium]|jgi:hypothetical protein|nr:hypothetical protein [Blastocatellia bacterium]
MSEQAHNLSTDPPAIKPAEVRQTLESILGSKYFSHAPQKRKFLRMICDFYLNDRASELNEYLIGREVFSRGAAYHPAEDPIVRVVAHDVRKKLEMYYQREGTDDAIRLQIPVGSYEPQFTRRPSRQSEPGPAPAPGSIEEMTAGAPSAEVMTAAPNRFRIWAIGCGVILLTGALAFCVFSNREMRRQMQAAEAQKIQPLSNAVWEPFLNKNDPTLLVLSNPLSCLIVAGNDPQARVKRSIELNATQATEITHFAQASRSTAVNNITPHPRLILSLDTFTGVGEAVGLYRLTDLFRSAERSLALKQSRTVSADDLKNHDVILLGGFLSNDWSGKLPITEDFVHTNSAMIENRRPQPGEEREYRPIFSQQNGDLVEDYALITVKPNILYENTVMVLAGSHSAGTEAAAEYVTSKNYLQEFTERLRQMGGSAGAPKYYQALLKVGVENGIPTTISLLTVHELRPSSR